MPAPTQEFLGYLSVQRYAASLERLPTEEQASRLALLAEFAEYVDRNPDQMVEELFDQVTRKYRKRGFYTERIREFGAQIPGGWSQQNARGNIVRSFFIANGYRIPPERPPWM